MKIELNGFEVFNLVLGVGLSAVSTYYMANKCLDVLGENLKLEKENNRLKRELINIRTYN